MGHIVDNAVNVGSLCFISVRFKTVTRSVSFLRRRSCCHPLLPSKTDSTTAQKKGTPKIVILMNLSSPPGQFFFFFWLHPSPTDSFVTYFDEKNETPHLLWPPAVLRRRFHCRAKNENWGSCRSWATLLNLPLIAGKRILRSLPYNDSQHSFLLVKP